MMPTQLDRICDPEAFEDLLRDLTGLDGRISPGVRKAVASLIASIGPSFDLADQVVENRFYGRLNQKLAANRDTIAVLYAECADAGLTFNYPTKRRLEWAINTSDMLELERRLEELGVPSGMVTSLMLKIHPVTHSGTRELLLAETKSPTKIRKAEERQVADDVFNAAAGPLAWSLWPEASLASAFSGLDMPYTGDYMKDLRFFQPELFERNRSLVVRQIIPEVKSNTEAQRQKLEQWLAAEYEALDNYGFIALVINMDGKGTVEGWHLASDLVLFAERFAEVDLKLRYFRPAEVQAETLTHVEGVDLSAAKFNLANEGFTYRDTFVLHDDQGRVCRLLVLLQKNRRDETLIPCPGCRSDYVRGNSYPSFGVKSWECQNPLCADRSIYNRGKRYDFRALLKQEAIETDGNLIPVESVREWQRDVLVFESDEKILDMLLRHYSMRGDVVVLIDAKDVPPDFAGRNVERGDALNQIVKPGDFWSSAFFCRYIPRPEDASTAAAVQESWQPKGWEVIQGDALTVLQRYPANIFDRAVTSPPYFNAREYAQWPNLYCYMRDMYCIASEVFRTLKPGGLFAYNIFDYFDNERIITFSDMGKKRIPLSALMVDAFRRIGFDYQGAVVWDKGEIHGKRGFNAGNFSPFYQSPFNCWEHVLIVQKPYQSSSDRDRGRLDCVNSVVKIHPVVKMVRGQNRHGHSAPYPLDLVACLLKGLPAGSHVLDPFGGSGTTARAALNADLTSVMIERDEEYCALSKRLTADFEKQLERQSMSYTLF